MHTITKDRSLKPQRTEREKGFCKHREKDYITGNSFNRKPFTQQPGKGIKPESYLPCFNCGIITEREHLMKTVSYQVKLMNAVFFFFSVNAGRERIRFAGVRSRLCRSQTLYLLYLIQRGFTSMILQLGVAEGKLPPRAFQVASALLLTAGKEGKVAK
ncbi:hypothetical protein CDAR_32881 [Caerostris darwini]|uniref:Uncharacterized protein n=1 Tax=Caerostris darwini TaxID=1538125 RepID=A0AAV4SP71_9ARAC|nr:hypothetical protein CDAR_32881 [Caerostris darwini]